MAAGDGLGMEQTAENAFLHALCHRPEQGVDGIIVEHLHGQEGFVRVMRHPVGRGKGQNDLTRTVAAGTADAAVLDLTLANAMIGEGTDYADLKIVDELNAEEYGVAFRKGSDTAAAVDEAFDALKADGTMQALADKYDLALAD